MSIFEQQPGVTDLISFLWERYKIYLNSQIEKKKEAGAKTISYLEALKRAPAESFVEFGRRYLAKYPCTETFPVDGGLGVRLANGVQAVIGATPNVTGVRQGNQPDTSVPIMSGRQSVAKSSDWTEI